MKPFHPPRYRWPFVSLVSAVLTLLCGFGHVSAQSLENMANGASGGVPLEPSAASVTLTRMTVVATSLVGEVSPSQVTTNSFGEVLTLDVLPTLRPGDSGISRLEITMPPELTNVAVLGLNVAGEDLSAKPDLPGDGEYSVTTTGAVLTVEVGTKVTLTQSRIRVLLAVDTPPSPGFVDLAVVAADGALTADVVAGDADGDPDNGNSLTVEVVFSQGIVLDLQKASNKDQATIGEVVTYSIAIRNTVPTDVTSIHVEDVIPPNFDYLEGSARLDGVSLPEPAGNRRLTFDVGTVSGLVDDNANDVADPGESGYALLQYQLVIGTGATPDRYPNRAIATDFCPTCVISNAAEADVDVVPAPEFELGTIVGTVFDDTDADGERDFGELGVPNALVALDDGSFAVADGHGRFHFPAVRPGQRMLKLDIHSVPNVARATTDETRVLWISPGILATADFGVQGQPLEIESIGNSALTGVAVEPGHSMPPLEVRGNSQTLSLLINGIEITLPSAQANIISQVGHDAAPPSDSRGDNPIRFQLASRGPQATSWALRILDVAGDPVRVFSGEGRPPATVTWDARGVDGELVEAGQLYQFQLEVRFADGTQALSSREFFGVNRRSVFALELTGNAFEVGSVELTPDAQEVLRKAAATLRANPNSRIVIEGHTDNIGSDAYNLKLSKRRAESTAKVTDLVGEGVVLEGHGERRPIAPNDFPEGRALNRRVVIKGEAIDAEMAEVIDHYHTTPVARINGEWLGIGEFGRFSTDTEADSMGSVMVGLRNSSGGSVVTRIAVPTVKLGFRSPQGWLISVAPDSDAGGASAPVTTQIVGRTAPENSVALDGAPVPVDADGLFRADLRVAAGRNTFGVLVTNPRGVTRIANVEIQVSDQDEEGRPLQVADEVPRLSVSLPPRAAKLPHSRLMVSGFTDPENRVEINGTAVTVEPGGRFRHLVQLPLGKSLVVVTCTDPAGHVGTIDRQVDVESNELFLLAFAETEFGRLEGSGFIEASGLEEASDYYTEGRVAYYLKGMIAGEFLVTSSLDTGRDELSRLFDGLDDVETQQLLTNLDPDRFYPVYGDSSTITYDSEASGKFYLSVEGRELDFAVGSAVMSLDETELTRYQRTLFGTRIAYESASRTRYGEPDTRIIVFGADVRHVHIRDELRATGGSLYYLSHRDLVEGGEQVSLVVRDADTGLVLSRHPQREDVDYQIKYDEGRLLFRRPVPSVADDETLFDTEILSGHPVSIQVDYESREGFLNDSAAGARVRRYIGDNVAVGGTYLEDTPTLESYQLHGVDTEIRFDEHSRVIAEFAESEGADANRFVSEDGGLTYLPAAVSAGSSGQAWKVATEIDAGRWLDDPGKLWIRAHVKKLESGFSSNGNTLERGSTKFGASGQYRFGSGHDVALRLHREDLDDDPEQGPDTIGEATIGTAHWTYVRERWGAAAEFQTSSSDDVSGQRVGSSSHGSVGFWRQVSDDVRVRLDRQQTLDGPTSDQTTIGAEVHVLGALALDVEATDGTRGQSVQGGAALALGGSRLYLTQRLAAGASGDSRSTIAGMESPLGRASRVYSEYQWVDSGGDPRVVSLVGLQRQWEITTGLIAVTSGELSKATASTTDLERTTLAGLIAYGAPGVQAQLRNEVRIDDGFSRRLQLSTSGQVDLHLNPDFAFLGRYRYSRTRDQDLDRVDAELKEHSAGLAYRPTTHDRANALARYTYLSDLRPDAGLGEDTSRRTMSVMSLDAAVSAHSRVEWVTKGAARILDEAPSGFESTRTHTYLGIQRLNVNAWRRLTLGAEYRLLRQTEADDKLQGWLTEVSWRLSRHLGLGTGYNFTDFSDNEFRMNDYSVRGWFVRAQGRY